MPSSLKDVVVCLRMGFIAHLQRLHAFFMFLTICKCYYELETFHISTYLNATSFRKLSSLSLLQCITECKIRTRCTSINYGRTGKTCELLEENISWCDQGVHAASHTRKAFVYGCKAEWNMSRYDACSVCRHSEKCSISADNTASCQMEYCDIPPIITNAEILGNLHTVGSKICYRCRDGFVNVGGNVNCSTCSSGGIWTQVTLQCEVPFSCDSGWVEYDGHCYIQNFRNQKWWDAQTDCQELGGYLLSIETEEEAQAMKNTFTEGGFWIGGNDDYADSAWRWETGEFLTYTNWDPGEPSNTYSYSDCMRVRYNWFWHDMNCYSTYESICEKEPAP